MQAPYRGVAAQSASTAPLSFGRQRSRSGGQLGGELGHCHRLHMPVLGELADVGVVGDEAHAEAVCGHHGREGLVGRPPYQPGVFPAALDVSDELRGAVVLVGHDQYALVM